MNSEAQRQKDLAQKHRAAVKKRLEAQGETQP
jgi:hypothetical protein